MEHSGAERFEGEHRFEDNGPISTRRLFQRQVCLHKTAFFGKSVKANAPHHTHDPEAGTLLFRTPGKTDALVDRILVWPMAPGELLIDDNHIQASRPPLTSTQSAYVPGP